MPQYYKTVAISLHPDLLERAKLRAEQLGFTTSFSAYVAKLVKEDVESAALNDAASDTATRALAREERRVGKKLPRPKP